MKGHKRGYSNALMLLLLLLFSLSGCFQQETNSEKPTAIHWIEDKTGALNFSDLLDKDLATEWNLASHQLPNFGFTQSAIWLSLPFENAKDVQTPMILEIAFPLHDKIDVYFLDGNSVVTHYQTGDQQPFSQRPINHRNFLFPYTLPPKTKLRAIVRLQSTDTMYLPVKVWESNEFLVRDQHEMLFLGIFFGFLSIMLIYNLLLYFSTQHKNYLYYAACSASIIYLQLTQKNLGYQYLWPDQPFFNHVSVPIASLTAIVSSSYFILKFLDLDKKQHAKIIFTFKFFIYTALLGIFYTLLIIGSSTSIAPYQAILLTTAVIGAIATTTIMGVLINLSIRGNQSAQLLSIAWLSLLVGSLFFVLGRIGIPVPMLITENAMLVGSTFEAALISFALARHIKRERDARMYAQELALMNERKTREVQNTLLALQEKTTQQLEQEVKERTKKLETAMLELTSANHKLDNLARQDGLTGLSNRRNFDQEFEYEWRSSSRLRQPISLIMADIDHFKDINDTYGHLFGDQCLIKVAGILKKCINRSEDIAARYGGEEFIIMLPNSDAARAGVVGERIRQGIEKINLNYRGKQVQFTISIGIANIVPIPGTNCIDLIASADQALYLAKEGGRNQVVTLNSSPPERRVIHLEEADEVY